MIISINGLSEIAGNYDAFIVDLWGVVHDGIRPYPEALNALKHLQGRPVLLLSNAPRRAASAQNMLRRMNIPDDLYTSILTSGEAVWLALRDRTHPWFARLGHRVYHLGPARDRNVLEGLNLTITPTPDTADFVVNTGPDDDMNDPGTLETFLPELNACLSANLPMICANPDRIVMRDNIRILCAGTLAEHYETLGANVISLGKPHPEIYQMALTNLATPKNRILAIGDSLHTDIAGATAANIDSLWVLGGIHAHATLNEHHALREAAGQTPAAMIRALCW